MYTHTPPQVHTRICIHKRIYVCVSCKYTRRHIYTHTYVQMYIYVYLFTRIYVRLLCVCERICIHINADNVVYFPPRILLRSIFLLSPQKNDFQTDSDVQHDSLIHLTCWSCHFGAGFQHE